MNKQTFTKFLKQIIEQDVKFEKLAQAIQVVAPDSYAPIFQITSISLDILEEAVGDKHDWISYWLYDLEQGKEWKKGKVTGKDDKDIPLKTISDLYNIIKNEDI